MARKMTEWPSKRGPTTKDRFLAKGVGNDLQAPIHQIIQGFARPLTSW